MESHQHFRPNDVRFQMTSGGRRRRILGCYLALDDALTIEHVVTYIGQRPRRNELLVAGDLKTDLDFTKGKHKVQGYRGGAGGGGT